MRCTFCNTEVVLVYGKNMFLILEDNTLVCGECITVAEANGVDVTTVPVAINPPPQEV